MKRLATAILLAATALAATTTHAAETVLEFDKGIGSGLPFRVNNNGTTADPTDDFPEPNNLFAGVAGAPVVNAGGQVWVIKSLKATVKSDGKLVARGKGLLLGGGANIGSRGGARQVYASLFVRNITTPVTFSGPYNTEAFDLDVNGDFTINGVLKDANGAVPTDFGDSTNNRPILLIRNAANNNWFAAGIVKNVPEP
jgi:hypothetical protein